MSDKENYVVLTCKKCGSPLEFEKPELIYVGGFRSTIPSNNAYLYRPKPSTLVCKQCGIKYFVCNNDY